MSVSVGGCTPFAQSQGDPVNVESNRKQIFPSVQFHLFRYWTTVQLDYQP